jgi:hypothetical protein
MGRRPLTENERPYGRYYSLNRRATLYREELIGGTSSGTRTQSQ